METTKAPILVILTKVRTQFIRLSSAPESALPGYTAPFELGPDLHRGDGVHGQPESENLTRTNFRGPSVQKSYPMRSCFAWGLKTRGAGITAFFGAL